MNTVYLDIETQHLMTEFPGGQKDKSNIKRLRLAVAGTLWNGIYNTFEESDMDKLILYLNSADKIVGHNLYSFDYAVLAGYFQFPEVILGTHSSGIIGKTFDTMTQFDRYASEILKRKISWVSLDDIAQRNFGMKKLHDGIEIPGMWKNGQYDEVKKYLLNDLEMTQKFYEAGCTGTNIKFNLKEFGVTKGEKEIFLKW